MSRKACSYRVAIRQDFSGAAAAFGLGHNFTTKVGIMHFNDSDYFLLKITIISDVNCFYYNTTLFPKKLLT